MQYGVADGEGRRADAIGHILRTCGACADGPIRRFAAARLRQKIRAYFAKVVGENVIRSLPFGAMDHLNRLRGEFHFWIQFGDCGIVPRFDFSEEYFGDGGTGEAKVAGNIRQVVDDDDADADEHRGKLEDRGAGFELLVGDRRVAAAEIAAAGEDVLRALARALGQITNHYERILFVIVIGPADVERFGQG